MSHFTTISTKIKDLASLKEVLRKMDGVFDDKTSIIEDGYGEKRTVDAWIRIGSVEIGLVKKQNFYDIVTDVVNRYYVDDIKAAYEEEVVLKAAKARGCDVKRVKVMNGVDLIITVS